LVAALKTARLHHAALVVSKVDRLTRSVAFLSKLLEANVDVRFADLPSIEGPTRRFMLQQMASVAELEAGMISDRTKKALAAAKANGKKLGGARCRVTVRMNGAKRYMAMWWLALRSPAGWLRRRCRPVLMPRLLTLPRSSKTFRHLGKRV
jgi:DNA invertase Pin-like site-specific DNA recombinase